MVSLPGTPYVVYNNVLYFYINGGLKKVIDEKHAEFMKEFKYNYNQLAMLELLKCLEDEEDEKQ